MQVPHRVLVQHAAVLTGVVALVTDVDKVDLRFLPVKKAENGLVGEANLQCMR